MRFYFTTFTVTITECWRDEVAVTIILYIPGEVVDGTKTPRWQVLRGAVFAAIVKESAESFGFIAGDALSVNEIVPLNPFNEVIPISTPFEVPAFIVKMVGSAAIEKLGLALGGVVVAVWADTVNIKVDTVRTQNTRAARTNVLFVFLGISMFPLNIHFISVF
jgi:hypothetical protein